MAGIFIVRVVTSLVTAVFLATSCASDEPESSDQSGELGADAADCFSLADELMTLVEANNSCTAPADCSVVAAWGLICLRPELETPGDCSLSVAVNSSSDLEDYYRRDAAITNCIDSSGNWVSQVFDGRACVTGCGIVPGVACVSGQCRIVDPGTTDGGS